MLGVLNHLINKADTLNVSKSILITYIEFRTAFNTYDPLPVSISEYIERIDYYTHSEEYIYFIVLLYFDRIIANCPWFFINSSNVYRYYLYIVD